MLHHPLFYCLLILAVQSTTAVESLLSGEWKDLASFETRAELSAAVGDGDRRYALRGLLIGKSADDGLVRTTGGVELRSGHSSGSYFALGPLRAAGLPYSLSNIFGKALHSGARQVLSSYSLASPSASTGPISVAAALSGPSDGVLWLRGTTTVDSAARATGLFGFGSSKNAAFSVSADALYSQGPLEAVGSDTWFSQEPPLPRRTHQLGALAATLNGPGSQFFIAGALSNTFGQGNGAYMKATADAEWGSIRCIAAFDAASRRFIDLSGTAFGPKARGLADFRRRGEHGRQLMIRAEFVVDDADLDSASMEAAYRFALTDSNAFIRVTEINGSAALSAAEDGTAAYRLDTATRAALGQTIANLSATATLNGSGIRESCGSTAKVAFSVRPLSISVGAGFLLDRAWKPSWSVSVGAAAQLASGIIMAKFGTDDHTTWDRLSGATPSRSALGPWTCTLSWVFKERGETRMLGID